MGKCKHNETIYEGLELPKEWEEKNSNLILKAIKKNERISDVMIEHIANVRNEEFGDNACNNVTDYEKKLLWSGFEMSRLLVMYKKDTLASMMEETKGMMGSFPGAGGMMGMMGPFSIPGGPGGPGMPGILEMMREIMKELEKRSGEDKKKDSDE